MKPEDFQKTFGIILLLTGVAIAVSLYVNGDDDKYTRAIDEAIQQNKELKEKKK